MPLWLGSRNGVSLGVGEGSKWVGGMMTGT